MKEVEARQFPPPITTFRRFSGQREDETDNAIPDGDREGAISHNESI